MKKCGCYIRRIKEMERTLDPVNASEGFKRTVPVPLSDTTCCALCRWTHRSCFIGFFDIEGDRYLSDTAKAAGSGLGEIYVNAETQQCRRMRAKRVSSRKRIFPNCFDQCAFTAPCHHRETI